MKESDKPKGFAAMHPIIHKFASAKGGKAKVPKGFALMPPERRKEVWASGGRAKHANRNTGPNTGPEEQ